MKQCVKKKKFKSYNEITRAAILTSLWCVYRLLSIYFTNYSGFSVVDSEQINLGWVLALLLLPYYCMI